MDTLLIAAALFLVPFLFIMALCIIARLVGYDIK